MRKVVFNFDTPWIGVGETEEFEFEDGTTDDEIQAEFEDWFNEKLEDMTGDWEKV